MDHLQGESWEGRGAGLARCAPRAPRDARWHAAPRPISPAPARRPRGRGKGAARALHPKCRARQAAQRARPRCSGSGAARPHAPPARAGGHPPRGQPAERHNAATPAAMGRELPQVAQVPQLLPGLHRLPRPGGGAPPAAGPAAPCAAPCCARRPAPAAGPAAHRRPAAAAAAGPVDAVGHGGAHHGAAVRAGASRLPVGAAPPPALPLRIPRISGGRGRLLAGARAAAQLRLRLGRQAAPAQVRAAAAAAAAAAARRRRCAAQLAAPACPA